MNPIITPARNYSTRNRKKYTRARRALAWLAAGLTIAALAIFLIA